MSRGNVLLRVDGSTEKGMGRLARSLALANALQRRRYQMTFMSAIDNQTWPDRIRRFRHQITKLSNKLDIDQEQTQVLAEIKRLSPMVMVVDYPNYDEEFLAMLANRVPLLISLDDQGSMRFPSDLVINPSLGLTRDDFQLYPGSQLVSGPRFTMIRSEFRRARNMRATEPGGPPNVLIALGGGDVVEDSFVCAKAILKSKKIDKVTVLLGANPRKTPKFDELVNEFGERLSVCHDAKDFGVRMTKSHLLVTGGGNTALEGACVGIPMMLISRSESQMRNVECLEELGVAQAVGQSGKLSQDQIRTTAESIVEDSLERKTMSRAGRKLIDGRGPDRIVTATEVLIRCNRSKRSVAA